MFRKIAGNSLNKPDNLPFVLNFATKANESAKQIPAFYVNNWDYNAKKQINSSTIPYLMMGSTNTLPLPGTTGSQNPTNPYDLDRDVIPDYDWE